MMKNKILTILLALTLSLPVYSTQEGEVSSIQQNNITEEIVQEEEQDVLPDAIEEIPETVLNQDSFKQPTSKRKIAKKFLFAMFSVVVSSLVIFAGLSIYNKLRENNSVPLNNKNDEPSSLETPDNLNDAIKSFLDRTHWEN